MINYLNFKQMKNLAKSIAVVLFASMGAIGCTQKPEDIKLSELESTCDYVDAIEICVDAAIEMMGDKEFEDLSEEEKEYLEVIEDKLEDIERAGSKKFTESEVKECPNFERVKEKVEKSPF